VKKTPSGSNAGLLIVATVLWGASSAVLARLGEADGTGAPLLASGGAVALALVVLAGPARRQIRKITLTPCRTANLLLIGLLEALNLGLYAAALALGPVPVVVALHLTSPVLLVALSVMRGHRRADGLVALQALLMVSGISLLGMQPADEPGSEPLLAGILAVGSAIAVAALIAAVARAAPTVNPDIAAAAQLTIAAAVTAPVMLVAAPPNQRDAIFLLVAGALFLGPGFAIYWRALRGLSVTTAGILGLNEAVAATIISYTFFAEEISMASVLSGVLVLTAVVLELLRKGARAQDTSAHLGDKFD
jgi:drug/metabolite transporter (DMT)-like permease